MPPRLRPEGASLFPKASRIVQDSGKVSTLSLQFTNILASFRPPTSDLEVLRVTYRGTEVLYLKGICFRGSALEKGRGSWGGGVGGGLASWTSPPVRALAP